MTFNASKYAHTADWVTNSELRKNLPLYLNTSPTIPYKILEIGSYQGMSACFFSDEWLEHPDSTLDCVDPFDLNDTTTPLDSETEKMFMENIQRSKNTSKITVHRMYSRNYFNSVSPLPLFDLIYIDGSHVPEDIIHDMEESYRRLKTGGIMWMDDYMGGRDDSIRKAMDATVKKLGNPPILHKSYQLAVRKI
jgi:predicted O-methyltransferase YrrM